MKSIPLAWMLSASAGITLAGDTGLFEAIRADDEKAVASLVHITAVQTAATRRASRR